MNKFVVSALVVGAWIAFAPPALAKNYFWQLTSPDHGQTWAYGTENNRAWKLWGGHLALLVTYTNDPFVDWQNPRQWETFRFDFPRVRIGSDGRTFHYHTADGRSIAVAAIRPGFLGIKEVKLLPNANAVVNTRGGYLTAYLNVFDPDGIPLSEQ